MKNYHNWVKIIALIIWASFDLKAQSSNVLLQADQFYNDNNWEKAFDLYAKITNKNPYNGHYWYRLGLIEKNRQNYNNSIQSLKKAIECGYQLANSHYNIAINYSSLGETAKAIINLQSAIAHGLNNRETLLLSDKGLDNLRNLEPFKKLVIPDTTKTNTRTKGWSEDIRFLKNQVELTHYRLHDYYPKLEWDRSFEKLTPKISELNDYEIIVELMGIMNQIGIGHSYIMPPYSGKNRFHQIPIELYEFSDGVFVKQTLPRYGVLLGKKIMSINSIPIEKILEKVSSVAIAENKIMKRRSSLLYATFSEILMAFEFASDVNKSVIGYLDENGNETTISMVHLPFSPDTFLTRKTNEGWATMNKTVDPPLFLSNLDRKFWFTYLSDSKIVYCQINEIGNETEKSFKEFGEDILRFINNNDVKALVLDLRFNLGGSGKLNKDFLNSIVKCEKVNQPGKLFTIIGNMTFSAAILLSTQLDQFTETMFIGEPSGGRPSHVGDDNEINLPHSGLKAYASKSFWQSPVPYDERNWIAPEVFIKPTSMEWKQGHDPCLEFVVDLINKEAQN
ncbi:MAG: hypothetical protein GYB37_00700 [Algicola sp.]|nr:hypothetical protein [Algicola sp.]